MSFDGSSETEAFLEKTGRRLDFIERTIRMTEETGGWRSSDGCFRAMDTKPATELVNYMLGEIQKDLARLLEERLKGEP
jgi:hypothetical protein